MKTCVIVDFMSILSVLKPYVFPKATQHTNNIDIELQAIAIAPCDKAQLQHIWVRTEIDRNCNFTGTWRHTTPRR